MERARYLRNKHVPEVVVAQVWCCAEAARRNRRQSVQRRHTAANRSLHNAYANAPIRDEGAEIQVAGRLEIEGLCKAVQGKQEAQAAEQKKASANPRPGGRFGPCLAPAEQEHESGE